MNPVRDKTLEMSADSPASRVSNGMKKAYFIGIGGIGMSALAQYFKDQGMTVTGSDRDPSPKVYEVLATKEIEVLVGHNASNVPTDADLVVYSDAVVDGSEGFVERLRARELGIKEESYFAALGEVSKGKKTVAVAGTHGKTTTTGMLAKILSDAGASPTAIVGSIVKDFGSNYLHGDSDLFVVEACEYKDHLLELSPEILVITNLEWDHTDWFPSLEVLQETFRKAISRVPANGAIVTDPANPNIAPLLVNAKAQVIDYTKEPAYELRLPGEFNQMNARAAAAAARVAFSQIENTTIYGSISNFQGTWRRFEYKGKTKNGADVYDDYAHHPTAVRETLRALRAKTDGKIYVAFHPHLYSRTRDLLDEFATAFVDADKVFIAPIYAAREVDDGTISSAILAERIRATGVDATALDSFGAIEKALNEVEQGDTIITMGAGDIYKVADNITKPIILAN
ncbi:MAG: Mur ligase family protein [Candidatus Parcubacteria bacterium]|nr:Mur ligase family protein [Candidatus Parcubacteria bacterium]